MASIPGGTPGIEAETLTGACPHIVMIPLGPKKNLNHALKSWTIVETCPIAARTSSIVMSALS